MGIADTIDNCSAPNEGEDKSESLTYGGLLAGGSAANTPMQHGTSDESYSVDLVCSVSLISFSDKSRLPTYMSEISLAQVDSTIGSHSMASVKSWLIGRGAKIASTARADFAAQVHDVLVKENLSIDELNEGMIDIEEAGGKRVYVFRIEVNLATIAIIRKQLLSICGSLSPKRIPAPRQPAATRRVYVIEDGNSFRAKWAETHIVYKSDLKTLSLVPIKETKLVVLILDKNTGVTQIRYDRPGTTHPHGTAGRSTAAEFYQSFRDLVETLLGVHLDPLELRPGLNKVINTNPRIVESRSIELSTEDNFTIKVTPKLRGKDVRDAKDMGAMTSHGTRTKVREVEDLTWFPQMSGKMITRLVKTHVDGRESFVRFEADYHEGEIVYVLGRLI